MADKPYIVKFTSGHHFLESGDNLKLEIVRDNGKEKAIKIDVFDKNNQCKHTGYYDVDDKGEYETVVVWSLGGSDKKNRFKTLITSGDFLYFTWDDRRSKSVMFRFFRFLFSWLNFFIDLGDLGVKSGSGGGLRN